MNSPLGVVVAIHTTSVAGQPLLPVETARAVPGRGLEGDRYHAKAGTFSTKPGAGRDVTLIEAEAIEALKRDYNVEVAASDTRRNIVTRGVALNHLIDCEFTVGEVRLRGVRLCEPCGYLAKMTSETVSKALIHRGGLRCDIITEGTIRIGDPITL